jgi:hypothetical protein
VVVEAASFQAFRKEYEQAANLPLGTGTKVSTTARKRPFAADG